MVFGLAAEVFVTWVHKQTDFSHSKSPIKVLQYHFKLYMVCMGPFCCVSLAHSGFIAMVLVQGLLSWLWQFLLLSYLT